MSKIVTKLIVIGVLIAIFVGVMIASVLLINQRSLQDGYIINIAGKERMLSQKITKEIFMINAQNHNDFAVLNDAIFELEYNLHTLRFGDADRGISAPSNATIAKKLAEIDTEWLDFKRAVESFKETSARLHEHRRFLNENNAQMLALSDSIVKAMVAAKMPPRDVDDSGRQRMLTQRISYMLLLYINTWDERAYRGFLDAFNQYDAILSSFVSAKYTGELGSAVDKTHAFWQDYSKHIQNVLELQKIATRDIYDISRKNTALLAQIDWVVNLYSDISTHSRLYLERFEYAATAIMVLLALYYVYHLVKIKGSLSLFVRKTGELASGKLAGSEFKSVVLEDSELFEADQNIARFLEQHQLDKTRETSKKAVNLSEDISEEVADICEQIRRKLVKSGAKISAQKRKSIEKSVALGEDMAIQSSEQLIATARLLDKLYRILREIDK